MKNIHSRTNPALIKYTILNGGKAINTQILMTNSLVCTKILVTCLSLATIYFLIHFKELYVHLLTIQQYSGLTYCGGIFDIP